MSSVSSAVALPIRTSLPTTARPIIYLGMDVHKESITIAVLPTGAKARHAWSGSRTIYPN